MSQPYPARLRGLLLACLALFGLGALPAQTADLSLALIQADAAPARYTPYAVTVTVTNDGPDAAEGVVVDLPRPDGLVFVGGDESAASQGRYRPYSTQAWTVGTLAPGQAATLTLNLFLLDPTAPDYYGQVTASSAADPDSAPGNGTPGAVNEDDEASVLLGTGGGAGADLSLSFTGLGDPPAFTNYSTTLTLRNDGPEAATGVVVSVPFEPGSSAVFVGGDEAVASQGTYSPYGSQRWRVGELAAGATATLRLNFFRRRGDLQEVYAQVTAAEQEDPDSTPGNGTPPSVNEDDEARTGDGDGGDDGGDDGGGDDGGGDDGDDECLAFTTAFDGFDLSSYREITSLTEDPDGGYSLTLRRSSDAGFGFEDRQVYRFGTDGRFLSASDVTVVPTVRTTFDAATGELVVTSGGTETRTAIDTDALAPDGLSLDAVSVRVIEGGYFLLARSGTEPFGSEGPYTLTAAFLDDTLALTSSFELADGLPAQRTDDIDFFGATGRGGYFLSLLDAGASDYYFFDAAAGLQSTYRYSYGGRPRFVLAVGPGPDGTVAVADEKEGASASLRRVVTNFDAATGTLISGASTPEFVVGEYSRSRPLVLTDGTLVSGIEPNLFTVTTPEGTNRVIEVLNARDVLLLARTDDGGFLAVATETDGGGAPTGHRLLLRFGPDGSADCSSPPPAADLAIEVTSAVDVRPGSFDPATIVAGADVAIRNEGPALFFSLVGYTTYLSTDATLSEDDVQLDFNFLTPELPAGEVINDRGAGVLPAGLAPGVYYLVFEVLGGELFPDSDTTNNVAAVAFTFDGTGGEALVVSPNPARRGGELLVALTPRGAGTAPRGAVAGTTAEALPAPTLLQVVDQRGLVVHTRVLPADAGGRYDLSDLDLPAGWYTVQLPGTGTVAQRFLVAE